MISGEVDAAKLTNRCTTNDVRQPPISTLSKSYWKHDIISLITQYTLGETKYIDNDIEFSTLSDGYYYGVTFYSTCSIEYCFYISHMSAVPAKIAIYMLNIWSQPDPQNDGVCNQRMFRYGIRRVLMIFLENENFDKSAKTGIYLHCDKCSRWTYSSTEVNNRIYHTLIWNNCNKLQGLIHRGLELLML